MSDLQPQIKSVIDILKKAHSDVSIVLTDGNLTLLRGRILMDLEKEVNFLSMQIGEQPVQTQAVAIAGGPLTSFLGKKLPVQNAPVIPVVNVLSEFQNDKIDPLAKDGVQGLFQSADELAAEELRMRRDELYKNFLTIESASLVDSYGDLEIRAVAKFVGLPVTETNPKYADIKFVDQIKEAIKKKNELEAIGKVGEGVNDETIQPVDAPIIPPVIPPVPVDTATKAKNK